MSETVRKTGIQLDLTGTFEKKLAGAIKGLDAVNKGIAAAHRAMDKGVRGAGAGASSAVKNAREESKLAILRQKTESTIAGIKGKESARSEVERQREQRANLQTIAQREKLNQIKAKGTAAERLADEKLRQGREAHISKVARAEQAHITKIVQMRERADHAAQLAQERINQGRMRTILLEDRLRRQEERRFREEMTHDQQRAAGFRDRVRQLAGGGDYYGTGSMMLNAGVGVIRGMVGLTHNDAFHHYAVERNGWEAMGLDKKHAGATQAGLEAAEALRRRIPGMNMAGALDTVKDLQLITGDIHEATNQRLLDQVGKFRVGMQTTYHLTDGQTYNAIKAADMLIQSRPGMSQEERMEQLFRNTDLVTQAVAGSAGKVNPNEVYGMLKQAKANRFTLSAEGFRALMPTVAELGGQRAGTEFTAFMTNVGAGRMPANIAQEWVRQGLIRPGQQRIEKGKFKGINAGGMIDPKLFFEHPVAWLAKYVFPKAAKMSAPEAKSFFSKLSGRVTTEDFIADNFFQRGQFDKDIANYRTAPGAAGVYGKQDPYLRAENEYNKAMETLHTKLAIVVLPGVTRGVKALTKGLEALNSAIEDHPWIAKTVAAGTALTAGAVAVGGAGLMAKGVWNGFKFLAGAEEAAAGQAIGTAVATSATRSFSAGSTAGIARAIAGLAGKGVLVVAAAGLGVFIGSKIRDGILSTDWGRAIEDKITDAMARAYQAIPGFGNPAPPTNLPGGLPSPRPRPGGAPPSAAGAHANPYYMPRSALAPAAGAHHPTVVINHHPDPHKTTVTINGKPARAIKNPGHIPAPGHS